MKRKNEKKDENTTNYLNCAEQDIYEQFRLCYVIILYIEVEH